MYSHCMLSHGVLSAFGVGVTFGGQMFDVPRVEDVFDMLDTDFTKFTEAINSWRRRCINRHRLAPYKAHCPVMIVIQFPVSVQLKHV